MGHFQGMSVYKIVCETAKLGLILLHKMSVKLKIGVHVSYPGFLNLFLSFSLDPVESGI